MRYRDYYRRRSERASRMAKVRWAKDRERRAAEVDPEELAEYLANPEPMEGDAIGSLEWRCFRTGAVKRWTVLRGDRCDRVMLRSPDGRRTKSHGWTWMLDHLRGFLAGTK